MKFQKCRNSYFRINLAINPVNFRYSEKIKITLIFLRNFLYHRICQLCRKKQILQKCSFDVGDGVLNDDDNNFIIPHSCLAIADSDILDDICGNLIREKRYEELANSAILSARNLDVEGIINGLWNYSTKHLKKYIQVLIVLKIVIIETLMKAFYPST